MWVLHTWLIAVLTVEDVKKVTPCFRRYAVRQDLTILRIDDVFCSCIGKAVPDLIEAMQCQYKSLSGVWVRNFHIGRKVGVYAGRFCAG